MFLGTSGSAPTAKRATSATLVRRGGDRLLIDCGEGTQRQLLRSDVGLVDLEEIFLTHFHADHYLGLPGMLKTFALRGREVPLTLYGPSGLRDLLGALRRVFGTLTYPVETVEIAPGRHSHALRLRDPGLRGRPPHARDRLRDRRGGPARALRRRHRRRARRALRTGARGPAAGRDGHPRRRRDHRTGPGARARPTRPLGRTAPATPRRPPPSSRRSTASTCSSTRPPSARTSSRGRERPGTRLRARPRSSPARPA